MPKKFDFLSPGIEIREIDLSVIPPAADEEGPIIIGRTLKGPAMKRRSRSRASAVKILFSGVLSHRTSRKSLRVLRIVTLWTMD